MIPIEDRYCAYVILVLELEERGGARRTTFDEVAWTASADAIV